MLLGVCGVSAQATLLYRSHVVFTLYLERRSGSGSREQIVRSKLHLVDLAGSERTGKTGSEGNTFKEATYINKSLTFLEQVVVALVDKGRDHIPYRQTKLTNVLKVRLACVLSHVTVALLLMVLLRLSVSMYRIASVGTAAPVWWRACGRRMLTSRKRWPRCDSPRA